MTSRAEQTLHAAFGDLILSVQAAPEIDWPGRLDAMHLEEVLTRLQDCFDIIELQEADPEEFHAELSECKAQLRSGIAQLSTLRQAALEVAWTAQGVAHSLPSSLASSTPCSSSSSASVASSSPLASVSSAASPNVSLAVPLLLRFGVAFTSEEVFSSISSDNLSRTCQKFVLAAVSAVQQVDDGNAAASSVQLSFSEAKGYLENFFKLHPAAQGIQLLTSIVVPLAVAWIQRPPPPQPNVPMFHLPNVTSLQVTINIGGGAQSSRAEVTQAVQQAITAAGVVAVAPASASSLAVEESDVHMRDEAQAASSAPAGASASSSSSGHSHALGESMMEQSSPHY